MIEEDLLTRIQALLALADDPDLNSRQLAGHQRNIIFEIRELIEDYKRKLKAGIIS